MFENLSIWLLFAGNIIKYLDFAFIPFSAVAFIIIRILAYIWKKDFSTDLFKSIWYFSMGLMYVENDLRVNIIVTSICFIKGFDLFVRNLEEANTKNIRWFGYWKW